jgi:hypothetical protein
MGYKGDVDPNYSEYVANVFAMFYLQGPEKGDPTPRNTEPLQSEHMLMPCNTVSIKKRLE